MEEEEEEEEAVAVAILVLGLGWVAFFECVRERVSAMGIGGKLCNEIVKRQASKVERMNGSGRWK